MMAKEYFNKNFNLKYFYKYLPELLVCIFFIYILTAKAEDSPVSMGSEHQGDTIIFSGYKWVVKESSGKHTGPGNNYFSGSKENVYVDKVGKLHLRITNRNDNWYCPEVRMVQSLGCGKYSFYLDQKQCDSR